MFVANVLFVLPRTQIRTACLTILLPHLVLLVCAEAVSRFDVHKLKPLKRYTDHEMDAQFARLAVADTDPTNSDLEHKHSGEKPILAELIVLFDRVTPSMLLRFGV